MEFAFHTGTMLLWEIAMNWSRREGKQIIVKPVYSNCHIPVTSYLLRILELTVNFKDMHKQASLRTENQSIYNMSNPWMVKDK